MIALLLASLASLAFGQDFEETKKDGEAVEEPQGTLALELGGALATGNTQYFTVNGSLSGAYKWGNNGLQTKAVGVYGMAVVDADADGTLSDAEIASGYTANAAKVQGYGRYDRYFGKNSLYALAGGLTDSFSGYDYRFNEQLGYSRQLIKNDNTEMLAEAGVDFAQENYVAGVDPNSNLVLAARVMWGFTHKFNENVSFTEAAEAYLNLLDFTDPIDLRVLNNAALSVKLSEAIGLQVSNSLIFDNRPVEGYRTFDQTTMMTVVITLL